MEYELIITESANNDLDSIFSYILNSLCNPKAANDFADLIEQKYEEIIKYPFMFEESRDNILRCKGYRRIPVNNYVILYKVTEESKEVIITRIFYGGQNYSEYL